MENIVLVGYGGHARSVIDTIEQSKSYEIVGYTDVQKDADSPYEYLGTDEILKQCYEQGVTNAFVTIGFMGNSELRQKKYKQLKEIGYQLPVIIDPSAVVAKEVLIDEGTFIGKKCVVNASSRLGKMCIINSGAVVDHDCKIKDYSHVAVGAVLCGGVSVGENSLIGAGATVIQTVKVGEQCIVGAGAVVIKDIQAKCTAVGVPAKVIKCQNEV